MRRAEHADADPVRVKRAAGCRRVYAVCQSGDDDAAALCNLIGDLPSHLQPVGRGGAGADDRDHRFVVDPGQLSPDIEHDRRRIDGPEPPGIESVLHRDDRKILTRAVRKDLVHAPEITPLERRGLGRAHAVDGGKGAGRREEHALGVAEAADQRRLGPHADRFERGEPNPVCHSRHVLLPSRQVLSLAISHMSTDAATAALSDSLRASMGMMISPSQRSSSSRLSP